MKTSRANHIPGSAGFTLLELMVVVVIVAILASVAIPGYQSQIRKSRRTEAKTALLDFAAREERYNSTHNAYSAAAGDLGYVANADGTVNVGNGYYTMTIAGDATTFSGTATPVTTQSQNYDTDCKAFTIDNTGSQGATGTLGNTCWN